MSKFNITDEYLDVDLSNISSNGLSDIQNFIFSILLDSNDKIKSTYISSIGVVDVFQVADATARLAISGPGEGDIAIQADDGSVWIYGPSSSWIELVYPRLLDMLTNVLITAPTDYHFLQYDRPTDKWKNKILELKACSDIYLPSLPNEGDFLRNISGLWTSVAVDIKTNFNSLDDVIITAPTNNQLLRYNGTNWINVDNEYVDNTIYGIHTSNENIHRQIGLPTNKYVPVGDGFTFPTALLELNLLDDVSLSLPDEGHLLRFDGMNWINQMAEHHDFVFSSRTLLLSDFGKTLYVNSVNNVTLTIPAGLTPEIGCMIKIVSMNNNRVILKCANFTSLNGKFNVLHGSQFYLYNYGIDTYMCVYNKDESHMYKNTVLAPVLGHIINTSYNIEYTYEDHNYISFSLTTGATRLYNTYNINTNTISNSNTTSGYLFGTDILNVNNTSYYSIEFDGAANLRMVATNNRYFSLSTTAISSQCKTCSTRILYDSGDGNIVVPFINTSDIYFIAKVSLNLAIITEVNCSTVLAASTILICGWHFNYGVMIAQENSNYIKILVGGDTVSFMNDSTRLAFAKQLDGDEYLAEARSTDKSGRFYFMTRKTSDYVIWSLNDVFNGVMKLITIPCISNILYTPSTIRDDVLYIVNNEEYQTGTYLSGVIKVQLTNFKIERECNILDLQSNASYVSFLIRRTYGSSVMGIPYNNTFSNIIYKAIV